MTHPTQQQLLAWLDGFADAGARAEDLAAHVAGCVQCQGVIDSAQDLGAAVRLWADDAAPAPAADLADQIFRAIAAGETRGDGAAAVVTQRAGADAPAGASRETNGAAAHGAPAARSEKTPAEARARVVPIGAARRRWWVAAAPVALAAAAAAVFLLTRPPRAKNSPIEPGHEAPQVAMRVDAGAPAPHEGPGNPPAPAPPEVMVASSEVLAVDPDGPDTNVSVMELAGEQAGSTVAVVWIDEQGTSGAGGEPPGGGSTVQ